jgi:hypothetical protein
MKDLTLKRKTSSSSGNGMGKDLVLVLADDMEKFAKMINKFVTYTREKKGDTFGQNPRPLNHNNGTVSMEYPFEMLPKSMIRRVGMDCWGSYQFAVEFPFKAKMWESEKIKTQNFVLYSSVSVEKVVELTNDQMIPLDVRMEILRLAKVCAKDKLDSYHKTRAARVEEMIKDVKIQLDETKELIESIHKSVPEMVAEVLEAERLMVAMKS